jgi:hypothetical protein
MGPSGSALTPNGHEKLRVRPRHCEVVVNDRERGHDVVDEAPSTLFGFAFRQLNANLELSHSDRSHCNIIVVVDYVVKAGGRPFSVNEKRRVKKQSAQKRSSESTNSRISRMDSIH